MSIWSDIKYAAEKAVDVVVDEAEETAGDVMSITDDVKHEIREISGSVVRDLFPEELRKDLPSALKGVEKEVVHEVVQRVIIPVLSDILKPIEKIVFTVGVQIMQTCYDETNKLLENVYEKPADLIDKAVIYAHYSDEPLKTTWAKWLGEMEVTGWPKDLDVERTDDFWNWQLEQWAGWKPFIDALVEYRKSNKYTREAIIEAFNKINFGVSNTGNVSIGTYFPNSYDRVPHIMATLHKYRNGLPATRTAILNFVREIGPDSVDLTVSGKLEIGIQIGGSAYAWGIPELLWELILDQALKTAGVPA